MTGETGGVCLYNIIHVVLQMWKTDRARIESLICWAISRNGFSRNCERAGAQRLSAPLSQAAGSNRMHSNGATEITCIKKAYLVGITTALARAGGNWWLAIIGMSRETLPSDMSPDRGLEIGMSPKLCWS